MGLGLGRSSPVYDEEKRQRAMAAQTAPGFVQAEAAERELAATPLAVTPDLASATVRQPTPEQVQTLSGAGQVSPDVASMYAGRNTPGQQGMPFGGITGDASRRLAGAQGRFNRQMAGAQEEMAIADEKLKTAIAEQGAAQAKAAEDTAAALAKRNESIDELERQHAQISEDRNKAIAEISSKIEGLTGEIDEFKINPERMFSGDRGTWNKVGAGIAIALGALGSALKGGPNQGLEAINAAIDNDIKKQHAALGNKKRALKGQQSLLELNKEKFGTMEAAIDATKLQHLDAAKRRIEQIQAGSQNQIQKQQAAEAIARIDQEIGARKANIAQQMMASAEKNIMQQAQLRQTDAAAAAAAAARAAPVIEGLDGGERASEGDKKTSQKVITSFNDTNRTINELMELRQKTGSMTMDRKSVARMRQLATQLQLSLKDQYGLGVLSDSDKEMLENIITSDPSEIGFVMERLRGLKKDSLASTQSKLKTYGGFRIPKLKLTDLQAQ